MQGPFTEGMNEALIDMYDISVMVTKQSGVTGGFFEKAEAAKKKNIPLFVIGLPESEEGISLNEVLKELNIHPDFHAEFLYVDYSNERPDYIRLSTDGVATDVDFNTVSFEIKD
jgi:hypothetical protein